MFIFVILSFVLISVAMAFSVFGCVFGICPTSFIWVQNLNISILAIGTIFAIIIFRKLKDNFARIKLTLLFFVTLTLSVITGYFGCVLYSCLLSTLPLLEITALINAIISIRILSKSGTFPKKILLLLVLLYIYIANLAAFYFMEIFLQAHLQSEGFMNNPNQDLFSQLLTEFIANFGLAK